MLQHRVYAPDRLIASAVLTRAERNFRKGLKDIFELALASVFMIFVIVWSQ
jgi:hypothetical protein